MTAPEPIATYRFQLTADFGFDAVAARLDHVARLGASHVYLSPIAEAVAGSSHGYDVVDHTRVRAAFGGEGGFETLLDDLAGRGMAAVIDHVPNHMASTRPDQNPMWWALLRDGPGSDADRWFDVDWDRGDGRAVLPVLGAPLDEVVAGGHVVVAGDAIEVYGERRLPIRPGTGEGTLRDVLDRQHYVLQWWREPLRNVRRFFTIDDLVGVRVEDPAVAAVVDTLPSRYAERPGFGGVRVDHVDGLADPAQYLAGLRRRIGPDALLWVEKIVAPGEWPPTAWPIDGTTGYEFIRACDHLLLAGHAVHVFDRLWRSTSGDARPFHDWEIAARNEVVDGALAPEADRLVDLAVAATGSTRADVAPELRRLTTELPRYRTYLPDDAEARALIAAIASGPVAAALLAGGELTRRWQQLTGPVMAKGAEDRSFYRYLRLASLCEVGGDPGRFGLDVEDFHAENRRRADERPRNLLAGSTHDTKRSEDVRSRSAALSWRAALAPDHVVAWWTAAADQLVAASELDAVTVSLALQTAITAPDVDPERLAAYLVKASREAALRTTWEDPDPVFEERLHDLSIAAVASAAGDPLELDHLAAGLSLTATTLRFTSPGVPDVYQGTEAITHRLVDPDNRVPPDWDALAVAGADERTVADAWADAAVETKTILTRTLLDLRRRWSSAFGAGSTYASIDLGTGAVGYRRGDDVIVVVRRGAASVTGPLEFPTGSWYDVLDPVAPTLSGTIDAASAVGSGDDGTLPIAVFERE